MCLFRKSVDCIIDMSAAALPDDHNSSRQVNFMGIARTISACVLIHTSLVVPAIALVGGAADVRGTGVGRHVVMIISTRGSVCTATALARDLLLTAGHCVAPPAMYRMLLQPPPDPKSLAVARIAVHPRYNPKNYASGRVTADVALVKLASPLPDDILPAVLADKRIVNPGDRFTITGYGVTQPESDDGLGTPRAAELIATGKPGNLQIRLLDPATRNQRAGLGACTGDSGGPAFIELQGTLAIIGVVSWSTGPNSEAGCGGLTGVTPLELYRPWVEEQARKMGSPIRP